MQETPSRRVPVLAIAGVLLGAGLVGVWGLFAGLFAAAVLRDPSWRHVADLLYAWQVSVAGLMAAGAAGLFAGAVAVQARGARRAAERQRARRVLALRATLPLLLDGAAEYLAESARAYARLAGAQSEAVVRASALAVPILPPESVDHLVDLIGALDPAESRPLILFLRNLQVHRAQARETRLRAGAAPGPTRSATVAHLVDTAELYARCAKLFAYARGDAAAPAAAPGFRDVQTSLLMLAASFPEAQELEDEVERRVRQGLQAGRAWPEQ